MVASIRFFVRYPMNEWLKNFFPACAERLPVGFWRKIWPSMPPEAAAERFPELVEAFVAASGGAGYLPDLARIELARDRLRNRTQEPATASDTLVINPALELVEVAWSPLLPLLSGTAANPEPLPQVLAFWRHPRTGQERQAVAGVEDLLALKVVAEQLDPLDIAAAAGRPVGVIDSALERAVNKGLLLAPAAILRRDDGFVIPAGTPEKFLRAEAFTLQWHITHRCDLHCRHCYDRSSRDDVPLIRGLEILDQLRAFCLRHHVGGQSSFSGGNPFLHPDFFQLYRAARDRNLNLAILGNPVAEEQLDALLQIARPSFFQVSLEGLREHNDLIRGAGSFAAVLDFLDLLRQKKVYSMVMLTLTRANLDQVLPLAEILRGRVDLFTYNRLAMVGEGASLESPYPEEYRAFVREYLKVRETNPVLALKDSLINIEREQQKQGLFGGCTGFGCGAAFNFVSLLPDGQVHACRKFPSLIGDLNRQTMEEIYHSPAARAYRRGCRACDACRLRPVCGGCLAVACGWGLDPLTEKDPGCFMEHVEQAIAIQKKICL
jgi:selenobiotic family peptide radical SAM maturase